MRIIRIEDFCNNIRLDVFTAIALLVGVFIPIYDARAVVIESNDKLENNYEIHHRIIIYENLSSYQNTSKKQSDHKQGLISQLYLSDNLLDGKDNKSDILAEKKETKLTQFPINSFSLSGSFTFTSKLRTNLLAENDQKDIYQKIAANFLLENKKNGENFNYLHILIGSFLDSFKNDPQMKAIFFTSKDLIFSYKSKIANILQLGFDTEASDYKRYIDSARNSPEEADRPLTEKERQNLKRETNLLFWNLSESYKTVLFVLLALFGAIYLSFRYVLNKFI